MASTSTHDKLQTELQTLKLVRATFESIRQLVEAVHTDVATMTGNCEALTDISKRWDEVINFPEAGKDDSENEKVGLGKR